MMKGSFLLLILSVLTLSGCASKYSCGAPQGESCRSIGEIYEARQQGNLAHQQKPGVSSGQPDSESVQLSERHRIVSVEPGDPLLSQPRVLRVWINRWEDRDEDLHDEQFIYLRMDQGRWLLGQEVH